jgi:hypothetical protein
MTLVSLRLQITLRDVEGVKVGETAQSSWNGTVELVISEMQIVRYFLHVVLVSFGCYL